MAEADVDELQPSPEVPVVPNFGLPESVLAVLPSDPYEQLDVARKITSIALASRVARLENETARLRARLADKDQLVVDLRSRADSLDASLSQLTSQLAHAQREKETLFSENTSLSSTVKKLQRDVAKLEVFKKTLMQSLQDEDEHAKVTPAAMLADAASIVDSSATEEDDSEISAKVPSIPIRLSGVRSTEQTGDSEVEASEQGRAYVLALQGSTPTRLTPPDSPPRVPSSRSPKGLSNPASPGWHSMPSPASRAMLEDRSPVFSSSPSPHYSSTASPFEPVNQTGRTRIDGKEFFRQVRSRLAYEHFSAFLANVKELNAHKKTREETLQKADEIFGMENKDLYAIFEGLITRNLH